MPSSPESQLDCLNLMIKRAGFYRPTKENVEQCVADLAVFGNNRKEALKLINAVKRLQGIALTKLVRLKLS